jgi:hypothetical protein
MTSQGGAVGGVHGSEYCALSYYATDEAAFYLSYLSDIKEQLDTRNAKTGSRLVKSMMTLATSKCSRKRIGCLDMRIFPLMVGIGCVALLTGCARFGYYKINKAERAPPAEAEKVVFPDSYESGIHLDGPTMAALEVARNEFMPPGVTATARDEKVARCLARRDTYDPGLFTKSGRSLA